MCKPTASHRRTSRTLPVGDLNHSSGALPEPTGRTARVLCKRGIAGSIFGIGFFVGLIFSNAWMALPSNNNKVNTSDHKYSLYSNSIKNK